MTFSRSSASISAFLLRSEELGLSVPTRFTARLSTIPGDGGAMVVLERLHFIATAANLVRSHAFIHRGAGRALAVWIVNASGCLALYLGAVGQSPYVQGL
jgi:hypothetical protein